MERQTVTVKEMGLALGVGRNLAYELVRTGQVPSLRLGGRIVVTKAALDRFLEGDAPANGSRRQHDDAGAL